MSLAWSALNLGMLALATTLVLTPMVRRAALSLGAVAHGGGRHVHRRAIPRWGGIALGAGFFFTLAVAGLLGVDIGAELARFGWPVTALVAGALIILAVGVVDDVFPLSIRSKLTGQTLAAVVAVWGGFGFSAFSNPFTGNHVDIAAIAPLASLLWIIGITNAFNLIDGLDGLAAGVGLIAALTLLAVSWAGDRPDAVLLFAALAGSLGGFLFFNFDPASIFLGDSGSLLLGYLLAVASIQSLQKGPTTVVLMIPILTLGLPIIETTVTVVRRSLVEGLAAVFHADADHIHHRLLASGLTQRRAVIVLYAACISLGLLAFLAVTTRGSLDAGILAVVIVATFWAGRQLGYPAQRLPVLVPDDARRAPAANDGDKIPHLCVVVLGDLGRSPRSAYHALAAAESGLDVDLVGELGTPLLYRIATHPRIRIHTLPTPQPIAWGAASRIAALAHAAARVTRQWIHLMRTLHSLPRMETLLVQSPPAIPALAAVLAVTRHRRAALIIDWHNFGFSMLAQRLPDQHPLVSLARRYEWSLGRRADAHLCVSQAMAAVLRAQLGEANISVLRDQPADHFRPLSIEEQQRTRQTLAAQVEWSELALPGAALAVSPSSFTHDEDMDMLFAALRRYGEQVSEWEQHGHRSTFPFLVVALSGKGERREACAQRALSLHAYKVCVRVLWVAADTYPDLIGAADLGICMHRSTSAVDLPMKVVDMQAAGVPVCAFDYGPCLREQIDDGVNGRLFRDAEELAQTLFTLLQGYPGPGPLTTLTRALQARPRVSFLEEWRRIARPLVAPRWRAGS